MPTLKNILIFLCLSLLLACTTTPAPPPKVVVDYKIQKITPPSGLLRPCYLPPNRKPKDGKEAANISNGWKLAAKSCAASMQELIDWYKP